MAALTIDARTRSRRDRLMRWLPLTLTFVVTRVICLAALALGGRQAAGTGGWGTALVSGAWHWDAHWYAGIALQGYHHVPGTGSNVAFFPATPTLMAWLGPLLGGPVPAGIVLSIVESAVAIALCVRVMTIVVGEEAARRGAFLLVLWPTSVFFALPYGDALLLLAATATFALAQDGRHLLAVMTGAVGALTKSTGAFLALPLALFIRQWNGRTDRRMLLALGLGGGTALYAFGLLLTFGQPLAFASAEAAGWHRVALPPPLPVAYTVLRVLFGWRLVADGRPDLVFADILDLGSIALVGFALWQHRRTVPASYLAWPAGGLLWPLLTGTTSVARYTLVLFPAFALFAAGASPRLWRWVVGAAGVALPIAAYTFGRGGWIG